MRKNFQPKERNPLVEHLNETEVDGEAKYVKTSISSFQDKRSPHKKLIATTLSYEKD